MNQMTMQQLQQAAQVAIQKSRAAEQQASDMAKQLGGVHQELARLGKNAQELKQALDRVQVSSRQGDPGIQHVENIPGRRIPFDLLVDIPIADGITSVQQGSVQISQEGPFVAVARYAYLLSAASFQVRDPENQGQVTTFNGRSFGRWRPIHSVWDLNDGQPHTQVVQAAAFPGTGAPHVVSPANASPFRSMQGDFRVKFENAGSSFPRSNIEVPSPAWVKAINDPFELGALDVFERGEVLTWKVLPLHANNPAFGNISGFGAPNPNYPFVDSGFDAIEGINDQNNPAAGDTDPVTRVWNAILTIGFHGYRIIQPAGAGPY